MAKAINTFLRSKMNKDLDARLIPNGEYRNAVNVQISKSEGDGVGTVENVLGNTLIFDFESITGVSNLYCIGYLSDDVSNTAFVFLTDNTTNAYKPTGIGSNHFIFACNPTAKDPILLVTGPFLNLSQLNPIYGINLLEGLLFWTDNRNQPRKININLANPQGEINTATYYTNEDQISVAKYNPYSCMQLYQESYLSSGDQYESTMKDVSSLFYPNGGKGSVAISQLIGETTVVLKSFVGDIQTSNSLYNGAKVSVTNGFTGEIETPASLVGATVDSFSFDSALNEWTITITGGTFPALETNQDVVLNPNPYYNPAFPGDEDFLEDKFVRFSYRFKFEDNEYSVFAPFTQIAFIPKQDGYFMYVKENSLGLKSFDDQADAYRSTVVYFVENKVDDIVLRIPLPFDNFNISDSLKIKEVDILYKEAQGLAVKVVDTIPVSDIVNSAGKFKVVSNTTVGGVSQLVVSDIQGGTPVGSLVTGFGISGKPKIAQFTPTNPNNPSSGGTIKLDLEETGIVANSVLQVNEVNYYNYNYQSKKPFKTLPENNLTRVYDKTPVRAFGQEISGNRVIYANYQDKHTPPEFLNYNVAVSAKSDFELNRKETSTTGTFTGNTISLSTASPAVVPEVGDFVTIISGTGTIPAGTQVTEVSATNPSSSISVTLNKDVTNVTASDLLLFQPSGDIQDTTSIVEYPNSTLKQNRNYQVGVVLSDRYSRTSGVILSSNRSVINVGSQAFSGSTIYSAYLDESVVMPGWPGNSLKLLFNETINSVKNPLTGTPGLYNGDPTSANYNPLGWYSWKIVVKQTEQEYYNVYLPGIMAAYPEDNTLELGSTSHTVLINDNINKVPRDLSEVGPQQRQFRSSVQLFGRVENTNIAITSANTNIGAANKPYYTENESDTVSIISTLQDLFDYEPINPPRPNYFPQFYSFESNPLIARISTESKIGQVSTTNYNTISFKIALTATTDLIRIKDISGGDGTASLGIIPGDPVIGDFSNEVVVGPNGYTQGGSVGPPTTITSASQTNEIIVASTSNITSGSIAVANGIPSGTSVIGINQTTITLSNTVNVGAATDVEFFNADTLDLSEVVSVQVDENATVRPASNPGLQYLAVYETEPTESLLDIFWETSSSGLISDLNNAILNDSNGGAGLSDINTSVFNEGIQAGDNISTTPFSILDNFGSQVPFADITSDLKLVSAFNALGEAVNDVNQGQATTNYFELVPVAPGVNSYNIIVTQTYFNNIYFGENDTSSGELRRNFTLNLRASVNDLESNYSIELSLANIPPNITSPNDGDQLSRNTTDEIVATVVAVNGAAANVQPNDFNVDFALNSCEITAVTNSAGQDVLPLNYFRIPQQGSISNNTRRWDVFNNLFDQNPLIPIDTYNITTRVKDAGGIQDSVSVSFSINYGAKVRGVKQFSYRWAVGHTGTGGGFNKDWWYQDITVFEVFDGAGSNQQGFYLYNGPWSSETTFQNYTYNYDGQTYPPVTANKSWPNNIPVLSDRPSSWRVYGPQLDPLLGNIGSNNQITVDHTTSNTPVTAGNLGTPAAGNNFLLFSQVSEAAVIQAWKDQFSSFPILSIQFPNTQPPPFVPRPGNYYADNGVIVDWLALDLLPKQGFPGIIIDDANGYNISSFSWTVI